MKRVLAASAFFLGLVLLRELAARSGRWSPVILPSPLTIAAHLRGAFQDGALFDATFVTMKRLLIGYVTGVALGLPLGFLCSASKYAEDAIGALALGFQTLPGVCWIPLALLWFGQTDSAPLFVVVMGAMWSVVIAIDMGARAISPSYAKAALTMGSDGFHKWTRVILPAAPPFLIPGAKQGWTFAWRSLKAAEIFVAILTGFGLGQLLRHGRELNAMDQVIGVMFVSVVIGLVADKALFAPWKRLLHSRCGAGSRNK